MLAKRTAREPFEQMMADSLDQLMVESSGHEDKLVKVIEESCGQDYILIGDNLDFLVKKTISSKKDRNKMIHWFHLIGLFVLRSFCRHLLLHPFSTTRRVSAHHHAVSSNTVQSLLGTS